MSWRILLTDFHRVGGGQVEYVLSLADQLREAGHEPAVAARADSRLAAECRERRHRVYDAFYFSRGLRPLELWSDLRRASRLLRSGAVDLVHVNGSQDHWVFALARRRNRSKIPLIRTRHNTYRIRDNFTNRLLNRSLTTRTITVCEWVKTHRLIGPGFDGRPIDVIHNGVDLEHFVEVEPDPTVRGEFSLPEDAVLIGVVARLVKEKGHRYLVEALGELVEKGRDRLHVLLIGEGTEGAAILEQAEALGVSDRLTFTGFRSDVRRLVSACDLGVLPSIGCDTSSIALKEMMAMRKPVVTTDHGGLPEIVDDGVNGFVVPAADGSALAAAIDRFLQDPGLARRLGVAAREKVEREFTRQLAFERTLESYRQALDAEQPASALANAH
ncbi:MAG: glycosyltransferase family 4 protein [Planctomycetota bacterium]